MKKLFTKSLAVFLSMLMCLTFAPFAFAEGETIEEPAAPKFKVELISETGTEAVIEITLTENEFKCLDFSLTGNENLNLAKIELNPDIVLTDGQTGSSSSNVENGMISFARTGSFVAEFKIGTYTFEKLTPAGVTADDFTAEIISCGLEGKVDVTDIAVIDMAIPTEHTHIAEGEWVETEASTCSNTGLEVRYCGICGEAAETRDTAKKEHAETKTEHKDATCTEDGYTREVCGACETVISIITIPATNHPETQTITVAEPTCEEPGVAHITCKNEDCKATVKVVDIPATGHLETETITVTEPTCDLPGVAHVICKACEEVLEEKTLPTTNHPETERVVVVDPTCTTPGVAQIICKDCEEVLKEEVVPKTGHSEELTIETVPATCTEDGYTKKICKTCNAVVEETVLPKTGHSEELTIETVPATCTEDGYTKKICKTCNVVVEEIVLPKTGHSDETTIDRKLATCTENGYIRNICTICKDIVAETILKSTGHGYIQDLQLPTCTEDGHSREYCPSCGDSRYEVGLPKTGHAWLGWKVVTQPTYAKDGVERRVCDNCGTDEERSIPKLVASPTELVLNMQEAGMNFRQTMRLFANVYPEESAYSAEIIWESSDESVLTVNEYGEVYAAGLGTATITAKTADGAVSATCEITVSYSVLQWIIVYILFGWIWYL